MKNRKEYFKKYYLQHKEKYKQCPKYKEYPKIIQIDGEEWRDIKGYEGLYQVSNMGNIKSLNYKRSGKEQILKLLEPSYIDGFALLGGEPFEEENQKELSELLMEIKKRFPTKDVWCYTGYILEKDLYEGGRKHTKYTNDMLKCIDVLVDGPFVREKKNLMLKFRGSENQRVLKLQETIQQNKPIYYFEDDK